MCGNFFNPHKTSFLGGFTPVPGILNGNFSQVRDALEADAVIAGNYFVPGSSLLTDKLVSQGAQNQLNSPAGMIANIGAGAVGGGFGSSFTGIPQSAGGAFEAGALSNFADSTGLSQLFGGTAAPSNDLLSGYNAINTTAPDLQATAGATAPQDFAPGGVSDSFRAAAGSPGSAGVGGGTLTGFGSDAGSIGEPSAIGSAQGGVPTGGFNFDINGNAATPASAGFGFGIGGTPPSPSVSSLFSSPTNTGSFNYDISGNPAGASSYSIPQQFANAGTPTATGGSSMLSNLFSGNNANMTNGLIRGGLGALLSNNNNKGYDAQINAGNQIQQDYAPYAQTGQLANTQLQGLFGLNGNGAQAAAQANWQNTPGYQFQMQQGLNAVNADAAAKGQLLSGNNQEAINNYAQGVANQTYNSYLQNLLGQQNVGLNAAGGVASGQAGVGNAQAGKSGQAANAQNMGLATGLQGLFPGMNSNILTQLLQGGGANNNGILQSLFG